MINLKLTDEQANWLLAHLEAILIDLHWSASSNEELKEHTETLIRKIREAKKGEWK